MDAAPTTATGALDPRAVQTPFAEDIIAEALDPNGARLIAVNGGVGTGKSFGIAQLMFVVATTRPGCDILFTQRTQGDMLQIQGVRCRSVFGGLPGVRWIQDSRWMRWEFTNGSRITFKEYVLHGTGDEASNSIEGRDYHMLVADEVGQLPAAFFMHSVERCRLPHADLNGTVFDPTVVWVGRPGAVDHWIREVEARTRNGSRGRVMYPRTMDNPVFWQRRDGVLENAYVESMRAGLPRDVFVCRTQETPGAQMPIEGAIYGDWSTDAWPDGNILHGYTVDTNAPIYIGADFGGTTDSYVWFQQVRIGGVELDVIIDEWHPGEWTSITDAVTGIRQRGWPLAAVICDPAGAQRSKLTADAATNIISVLRREHDEDPDGLGGGLACRVIAETDSRKKPIESGILKVRARVLSAANVRGLVCTAELWERARNAPAGARSWRQTVLQYARGSDGSPLKGARGHNADHCADAVRYYIRWARWGSTERKPLGYVPQPTGIGAGALSIARREA